MKVDVGFHIGPHSDIILENGGDQYNLGYHYTSHFPVMLWLAHKQLGEGNIFRGLALPSFDAVYTSDHDLEALLDEALDLSSVLPLSADEFNDTAYLRHLSCFTDGSNRVRYAFRVGGDDQVYSVHLDRNPYSDDEVRVLTLNSSGARAFLSSYLSLVSDEASRLERTFVDMSRVIPLLSAQD